MSLFCCSDAQTLFEDELYVGASTLSVSCSERVEREAGTPGRVREGRRKTVAMSRSRSTERTRHSWDKTGMTDDRRVRVFVRSPSFFIKQSRHPPSWAYRRPLPPRADRCEEEEEEKEEEMEKWRKRWKKRRRKDLASARSLDDVVLTHD